MKYFIPLLLFLTSCKGGLKVKDFDHPIDVVKQQKLINAESTIVTIDTFKLSMISLVVAVLVVGGWWFVAYKANKSQS
tara:strand:- start:534 stop:767 length:234 start_codon:yes stop_codon:yes gene_type:complete